MTRLALVLRLDTLIAVIYGLGFVFIPGPIVEDMFGWDGVDHTWVRAVGVAFLGLGWIAWLVAADVERRIDIVLPLTLVPAGLAVGFVVERYVTDSYAGPDGFWWVSFVVSVLLTLALLWGRQGASQT